jgi:hypothetical protein
MAAIPAIASVAGTVMSMAGKGGGSGGSSSSGNTVQNQTQQTQYPDWYNQYTQNVLQRGTEAANKPYEAYDVNKMFAPFTGDQNQAFNQIRSYQGAYQPYFDQASGALNRVAGYDSQKTAQPYLDAAGNAVRPWEAGAQGIAGSMGKWTDPGNRDAYMQDYSGALARANELTQRGFEEKFLPGANSQFVKGQGQLGRGNYQKMVGRGMRDMSNEMSGNSITAMNDAYKNAASIYASDESRQQAGGIAQTNAANTNMSALGDLASRNATITSGAVQNGINVGNAYSTQAGALSNLNLMNTNALLQAGNQQQQQNQLPLTAQFQQWQQEQQKPYTDASFLSNLQRGLQIPTTTTTNSTSTQGGYNTSSSTPSLPGQIMGGLSSVNTLGATTDAKGNTTGGLQNFGNWVGNQFGGSNNTPPPQTIDQEISNWSNYGTPATAARGGQIRRYAMGGQTFGPITEPRGILSRRRRQEYAVGGDVPVARGMKSRNMPKGPPGALGGLPPPPRPPAAGGPFGRSGGIPMPPPPPTAALPRPRDGGLGALGMMR